MGIPDLVESRSFGYRAFCSGVRSLSTESLPADCWHSAMVSEGAPWEGEPSVEWFRFQAREVQGLGFKVYGLRVSV